MYLAARLFSRPGLLGGIAFGVLAALHFLGADSAVAGSPHSYSDARLKRDIQPL